MCIGAHAVHVLVCAPGVDCQVKVWDVRTFKPLHAYFANSPATALDISQRGLLAVGQGRRLQVGAVCVFCVKATNQGFLLEPQHVRVKFVRSCGLHGLHLAAEGWTAARKKALL